MKGHSGALAWIGLACWLAGCGGGGSDALSETAVRECLAHAHIGLQAPPGSRQGATQYAPLYLDTAPDFTVYARDGAAVDVVVQGSTERAQRTASHARGALESLGNSSAAATSRVVSGRNVIAVFHRAPSAADRAAVRSCLLGP